MGKSRVIWLLTFSLLLPLQYISISQVHAAPTSPVYTGLATQSGPENAWITLSGQNLSHDPGRTSGYENVYYTQYDASLNFNSGPALIAPAKVRNNPANNGTIQVLVPAGVAYYEFQVDSCDDLTSSDPVIRNCHSDTPGDLYFQSGALSLTFDGLNSSSGANQWVTIKGSNLAHVDSTTLGWQDVYYSPAGQTNWVNVGSGNVRNFANNAADGTSYIQARLPATSGTYVFLVNACTIWDPAIGAAGCVSLNSSDTYSILTPSTFTGITPTSGGDGDWITIQGANLSHATPNTPGYQTIYYGSAPSWIAISDTTAVRDNPANDGTIQVRAPAGVTSLQFHIDACTDWTIGSDTNTGNFCYGLDNSATFTNARVQVTVHNNNGDTDTLSVLNSGDTFQLPPAPTRSHFVFKEWNDAANGSGYSYAPATSLTISGNSDFYAQWIPDTDPLISLYIDAPFVQNSYATGSKVRNENFNELPGSGVGACDSATLAIGVVSSGTCSLYNSADFGASSISSNPETGGSGSNMVSDNAGGQNIEIQFTNNKKYVGFWWASGSNGNQVEFLAGGQVVSTLNVNQLFGIFGSAPAPSDYASSNNQVRAIGGNFYYKKNYFGNPDGYSSLTPNSLSSVLPNEPFVYIHAFADNGAYFDGIRFSGPGFEFDNISTSQTNIPIINRLVQVQSIAANAGALNANEKIYFTTYHADNSDGGAIPVDSQSPYASGDTATVLANVNSMTRSGYTLIKWNTLANGAGVNFNFGDTLTITDDVDLYPVWDAVPNPPAPLAPPSSPASGGPALTGSIQDSTTALPSHGTKQDKTSSPPTTTGNSTGKATTESEVKTPVLATIQRLKKLGTIYFNNNEYFLDAADRRDLKRISTIATKKNFAKLVAEGNTDVKKGVDNLLLSQQRAEAVKAYLGNLARSVEIKSIWFASNKPVVFGTTSKQLAANRRVDIYAIEDSPEPANVTAEPNAKISLELDSVGFLRNEYFLDALDRKTITANVARAVKLGCLKITLQGSKDSKKGENNLTIADDRAKAVKAYMYRQYPTLRFGFQPSLILEERLVKISCTN